MSRSDDSAHAILEQQLDHDRRFRAVERLYDLIIVGSKSLALLNGGAVVAMLAFIQALVGKPVYAAFKMFGFWALVAFLAGAFFASIPFFAQYAQVNHAFNETGKHHLWRSVVWWLLVTSALCAFVGGFLIAIGIFISF